MLVLASRAGWSNDAIDSWLSNLKKIRGFGAPVDDKRTDDLLPGECRKGNKMILYDVL